MVWTLKRVTKAQDEPPCNSKSRVPNLDGTCNNLNNPFLGSAKTSFIRLPRAGADYADGISRPRQAQDGNDLPNTRRVSFKLFTNSDRPSAIVSHLAMTWGELRFTPNRSNVLIILDVYLSNVV